MQENQFQHSVEVNGRKVRVLHEVAKGSFGVKVFLGKTQEMDYVALKMIPAHPQKRRNMKCLPFGGPWCCKGERQTAMKVAAEIKVMERFKRANSPNLLTIRDSQRFAEFMGQKCHFIVMDYAQHLDLFFYISHHGIHPKIVFTIVREVAKALIAIHGMGFIHADVKPENIMLDADFRPKLTDFDYSCSIKNGRKLNSGTFMYVAPEIFYNKNCIDTAVDIWALGVSLLFLLTGQCPFNGDPRHCERYKQILMGYWFGFWYQFSLEVPQEYREIVQYMLQPDVCSRPTSTDLLDALTYGRGYSNVPCPEYYKDLRDPGYQQKMSEMYLGACKRYKLKSFDEMTANDENFDAGETAPSPALADPSFDETGSNQGSFDQGVVTSAGTPNYELTPPVIEALSSETPEVEKSFSKSYRSPMSKLKRRFSFGSTKNTSASKKDASSKKTKKKRNKSIPSLSFTFSYKKSFRRKKNKKSGSKSFRKKNLEI